jgi:hypothetical protein
VALSANFKKGARGRCETATSARAGAASGRGLGPNLSEWTQTGQ